MGEPATASGAASKRGRIQHLRDKFTLFRKRFGRARRWFRARYMKIDPRTLGLYRIVIGALLVGNCIHHWTYARTYYSNEGVLTNHFHLFRPSSSFNFSLFHSFSSLTEVHVAFGLSLICYFLFMVGWHARLFAVLSCVWVTSMDHRLIMVENGGYVVVNLTIFWACFMPIGQRFSVDSLLRSYRQRRERTTEALNERWRPDWFDKPFHSLVAFIVVANLATVYIFNVVNKFGSTWRAGLTVHYVLHIDRMATGIAVWFRELVPFWATVPLTHLTLVHEAMLVMLILWPSDRRWTRPVAIIGVGLLHLAFGVIFRLGPFSWFMIGWSFVLLHRSNWDAMDRWYRQRTPGLTVRFAADNGSAFQVCRLLSRLDRSERLSFEANGESGGAWFSLVRSDGSKLEGRRALWASTRVLPGGALLGPLLRIASLGALDVAVAWMSAQPKGISRFFGLQPAATTGAAAVEKIDGASAYSQSVGKWRGRLRELVLAYLVACALSQMVNENKSIPKLLKHTQPFIVQVTLQYPRIFQGWGMFAPNPIRHDGVLAVDALTIDGRHVDPFTGAVPDLNLSDARGMGLGQVPQDYANRIRLDRNRAFRKPLRQFLSHWHETTGQPADEIIWFNVYWLRDKNPAPGSLEPTEHEKICIASWRKPRYRNMPGKPRLPKRCAVKSADAVKKDKKDAKE